MFLTKHRITNSNKYNKLFNRYSLYIWKAYKIYKISFKQMIKYFINYHFINQVFNPLNVILFKNKIK